MSEGGKITSVYSETGHGSGVTEVGDCIAVCK
jgi:hypothetical protein